MVSLDVFRGATIAAMILVNDPGSWGHIYPPLEHAEWNGWTPTDLIFPFFLFIVGVSLTLSFASRIARGITRRALVIHVVRRSALIFAIGLFLNGFPDFDLSSIRIMGVLQRIALCYLVAGLLYLATFQREPSADRPARVRANLRVTAAVAIVLLVGYWALMTFVPVPGVGSGNFAEGKNLANYLDASYLPLRKWDGDHDPEGLLSTLPANATCLLGVFAGTLLQKKGLPDIKKVLWLVVGGLSLLALGWLWDLQFPVIKKLWTSSYVLVAGGYSCLLLAAFYQVVDVWKYRAWAQPFVWIGMNSITIYMAHNLIDFDKIAQRFVGGDLNHFFGRFGQLAIASVVIAMMFGLCYFLYRRKIFLRV